jgi:hypothetical protein
MPRLYAVCIVALILGACGTYTYQNTHSRQTLVPSMPAGQWDEYVQRGGAFNAAR